MKVCLCSSRHCSEFLISGYVNNSFPGFMSIYYIIQRNDPPTSRISHLNELREKVTNGICPYSYNKFGV